MGCRNVYVPPTPEPAAPPKRSKAHYPWAVLIARIYEVFPLLCPIFVGQTKYARESLQAIAEAMRYLQSHPFLVDGRSPDLKSARQKMQTLARKCGLVGQYSPHSLRYRYAVDKLMEMRSAGVTAVEALIERMFAQQGLESLTPAQRVPPSSVPKQKRDQSSIKARRLSSRFHLR